MSELRKHAVMLACFGKHPGWNDHIDDIGIETTDLADAKRLLYLEGIGGNIDSGSWESLDENARIPGYAHDFLWRWRGSILFGRMWSSVDGKGRTRYPMILCASIPDNKLEWATSQGLQILEELEETCRITEIAEEVIAAVESTRVRLEASYESALPSREQSQSTILSVKSHETLNAKEDGFERVMYQIERDMNAFTRPLGEKTRGASTRLEGVRAQHARVPRCAPTSGAALETWARFSAERFAHSAPIFLVAPRDREFVDVIAGEPEVAQLMCVRADEEAIPCACDVPYTLDSDDKARIADEAHAAKPTEFLVEASLVGGLGKTVGKIAKAPKRQDGAPSSGGFKPSPLVIGGVLVGIAIILGVGFAVLGPSNQNSEEPDETNSSSDQSNQSSSSSSSSQGSNRSSNTGNTANREGTGSRPIPPDGRLEGDALARWQRVCDDYIGWFREFSRVADESQLAVDPHLRETVIPVIRDARELNPQVIAQASVPLQQLRDRPPESAGKGTARLKTEDAEIAFDGIRAALESQNWPARATLESTADALRAIGLENSAATVSRPSTSLNFESGVSLAGAIRSIIDASAPAESIRTRTDDLAQRLSVLESRGDPLLASARSMVQGWDTQLSADAPPAEAASLIARANRVLERASALADNDELWSSIDHERLRESDLYAQIDAPDETLFASWHALAVSDEVRIVSEIDDPRSGWDPSPRIEQLAAALTLARSEQALSEDDASRLQATLEEARTNGETARAESIVMAEVPDMTARLSSIDSSIEQAGREIESAVATLTSQHAAFVRDLQSSSRPGSYPSASLDGAHAQGVASLLELYPDVSGFLKLREQSESLNAAIGHAETSWPGPFSPDSAASWLDTSALDRASESRRERGFESIASLEIWSGSFDNRMELDDRVFRLKVDENVWRDETNRLIAGIEESNQLLDAGGGVGRDWTAEGASAMVDAWRNAPTFAEIEPALRQGLDRVERVLAVSGLTDASALDAALASEDTADAIAAFRALDAREDWPTNAAQLEGYLARLASLESQVSTKLSSTAPELAVSITEERRAAWLRVTGAAPTLDELRACLALQETAGGDREALSERIRFELRMLEISQTLRDEADTASEQQLRGSLASAAESLRAIGHDPSDAQANWLEKADRLAAGDDSAVPVADFSQAGLTQSGWTPQVLDEGARVRFSKPNGTSLVFLRVPSEDPAQTAARFIMDREVTIAQFSEIMRGLDPASLIDIWAEFKQARGAQAGNWKGPRGWVWDTDSSWFTEGDRWLIARQIATRYSPDAEPEPPEPETPMHAISYSAAALAAENVGTRLPTLAEWRAMAVADLAALSASPESLNMRDATWLAQLEFQKRQRAASIIAEWPDEGIFLPLEVAAATFSDAEPATSANDGSLWLRPAIESSSMPETGVDWVGNVSEFITNEAQPSVIGGSALSPSEIPIDQPVSLANWGLTVGAADIGFRLAFTIEGGGVGVGLPARIRRLMLDAPIMVGDDG